MKCAKEKKIYKKKKSRIYQTTDGYLRNNAKNKKKRLVIVADERKSDGAFAVVKIHRKSNKAGNYYVDNLVLSPKDHNSIKDDSIVETRVIFGIKNKSGYKPIYEGDLVSMNDRLSLCEYLKLKRQLGGKTRKNRKTHKKTLKRWKKHFKK